MVDTRLVHDTIGFALRTNLEINAIDTDSITPLEYVSKMLESDTKLKEWGAKQHQLDSFLDKFSEETTWQDVFRFEKDAYYAVENAEKRGEILEGWDDKEKDKSEGRGR